MANESLDEKIFDVPAEFQEDRLDLEHGAVRGDVPALSRRRRCLLGGGGREAAALVQEVGLRAEPRLRERQGPLVRGRQAERLLQLPRPPSGHPGTADKVAYYFEGDSPDSTRTITYRQLWEEVTKFANVLKKKGVKKGDRVIIYLPMIPELPVAMLACARIGAIHCVVFGGFSAEALRDRVAQRRRDRS